MAKAIAVGIGFGSIYGVATGQFVLGLLLGAAAGFGFSVSRSYATR
jgi:MFS-type transporter involved in bile tolerance (Atg22 family)